MPLHSKSGSSMIPANVQPLRARHNLEKSVRIEWQDAVTLYIHKAGEFRFELLALASIS